MTAKMKNVFVVTHEGDPHAEAVSNCLAKMGAHFFLLAAETMAASYSMTYDGTIKIVQGEESVQIDERWNIWNRRLRPLQLPGYVHPELEKIAQGEAEDFWKAMLNLHPAKVVSRPRAIAAANNKLEQMRYVTAHHPAIHVPDTLVSNDPLALRAFYDGHHGEVCFKLLKGAAPEIAGERYFIYTNKVKPEHLERGESVRSQPVLFQEYVDKAYELRVIVIGEEVIPIAIHSQDAEISQIDFRRYDFAKVKYEHKAVSPDLEHLCRDMVGHYGLDFGAFDIILDKEGRYVFLELNPNGQWLWLEQLSGYRISEHVAAYLIQERGGP